MKKTTKRMLATSLVVILVLIASAFTSINVSNETRENSVKYAKVIAQARSLSIQSYVKNTIATMKGYASANEIQDLLVKPGDKEAVAAAQRFTDNFSKTVEGLEDVYVCDWKNSKFLAHTNKSLVGTVVDTRRYTIPGLEPGEEAKMKAESLGETKGAMQAIPDGIFNPGFRPSPQTGEQVASMYMLIRGADGNPLGFVGLDIHTDVLDNIVESIHMNTENAVYNMVECSQKIFIFNKDESLIGQPVENNDLLRLAGEFYGDPANGVFGTNEYQDGSYENGNCISTYYYLPEMGWMFTIDTPKKDIFSFANNVITNIIAFTVLCLILIVIFNYVSIKQDASLEKLEKSKKKQAAITKNLHTAALKDILTDVNNRIKFVDDFSKDDSGNYKVEDSPNTPYCFIMFNLPRFSQINIMYGHDTGDIVLATTANILKEHFGAQNVYRTGSDEFVVVMQSTSTNPASVVMEANGVLSELRRSRKIGNNMLNVAYTAAVVKKSTAISSSVLITLKDMINNTTTATESNAAFVDLDTV